MSQSLEDRASRLEQLLSRTMRSLFRVDEKEALSELSVAQIRVLRILSQKSRTVSELSEELKLSPSAITQIANRLVASGLVARSEDSVDRRVRHMALTAKGLEKMLQRQAGRVQRVADVLELLPEAEQVRIVVALECLSEAGLLLHASAGENSMQTEAEIQHVLPVPFQSEVTL